MNRDVFAKHIVIADAQARGFAVIFQILRRIANHATRVELVARAHRRVPREMHVRPDAAVGTDDDVGINHRVRPDAHTRMKLRLRMNDSGGMNQRHGGFQS